MKKNKEFWFVSCSFLFFTIVFVRCLKGEDIIGLYQLLKFEYIFGAIGLLFAFWGLEALMMRQLIIQMQKRGEVIEGNIAWIALKTTLIGQYYSHITPFSSGGQPMQLYWLKRHNISTSHGTGVLVSKFLVYQITVTVYALTLALLNMKWIENAHFGVVATLMTGLAINTFGLLVIIFIAFNPKGLAYIASLFIKWGHGLGWIKYPKVHLDKMDGFIKEYAEGMDKLKEEPMQTLHLFLLSIVQISLFFGITVMVYHAIGLSGAKLMQIITLQAVVYMCVSFVPVPGTLGASEIGFTAVLTSVFTQNFVGVAMILWRFISYYFSLIFCGLFTAWVSLGTEAKS